MVQHKSVHFHCPDGKKSKNFEQILEPDGMTNIDLKDVQVVEEDSQEENEVKVINSNLVRKYIVKSLVICMFIIFGMVILLSIVPGEIGIKRSWNNFFHFNNSNSPADLDLINLITSYTEKLQKCKETKNVENCCAVLAEFHNNFAIEACSIDVIKSIIRDFDEYPNINEDHLLLDHGNNDLTNNTKEDILLNKTYNDIDPDVDETNKNGFESLQNEEGSKINQNEIFESRVKISTFLKPIIDDRNLNLEGDDIAILLTNGIITRRKPKWSKMVKRQVAQQPYYWFSNEMNAHPIYPLETNYHNMDPMQYNFIPHSDHDERKFENHANRDDKYQYGNVQSDLNNFPHQPMQMEEHPKQYSPQAHDVAYVNNKYVQDNLYEGNINKLSESSSSPIHEKKYHYTNHQEAKNEQTTLHLNSEVISNHKESTEEQTIKSEYMQRKYKFIEDENKKKSQDSSKEKEDSIHSSSLNQILTSTQCVPYTPPSGPSFVPQQSYPSYGYDPNARYAELIPINRNPSSSYVINPQFTYVNPNYLPMNSMGSPVAPSMASQYYNPIYMSQTIPNAPATNPSGQYFICNPVPAPVSSGHLSSIPGVEIRQSNADNLQDMLESVEKDHSNKTRASEMCSPGEVSCADDSKCIKESHICDNEIDCKDSSDEIGCSCVDRVGPSRLCDGYFDCPNGEDEWTCFGCSKNSFNCDDWDNDRDSTCIPMTQRCDGTVQCPTGKDEEDCSALSETFGKPLPTYKISNAIGFLYKNYKGKWYPACSNSEVWASNACERESGPSILTPLTRLVPVKNKYSGSYINARPGNEVDVVNSCVLGFAVHVECPIPTCGKRTMNRNLYRSHEIDDRSEETLSMSQNLTLKELVGDSRVVGGRASQPAAWPWVVTIYRNGIFHCGGVIISDSWILTAAHCVDKFSKYYFEVEAGILRRFSFSPMQQTRYISHVATHNAYDRANLKNDLAVVKISTPFKFNRYVRPICLPGELTAGRSYLTGPPPGTFCTAVGWGATVERGPDPDHLREVEVPVLSHCKHLEDEDGQEICAGFSEGGKDACQGDSGGPFMCRNPNSPNQWYLAGIVSHGEGCARPNEPGAYTRVSLYLDWIFENTRSSLLPLRTPLHKCPGYQCKGTNKCLPKKRRCDRIVDCLLGDDELQCIRNRMDNIFDQAMRHMVLVGSPLNRSEVNKLGDATVTEETTTVGTEATTSIIVADATTGRGFSPDNILRSASKMESSPITVHLNVNGTDDTSFARTPISDQEQATTTPSDEDNLETTTMSIYMVWYHMLKQEKIPPSPPNETTINPRLYYFRCRNMNQFVKRYERCDGYANCEDATDEQNCTCWEILKTYFPESICDGVVDCYDSGDEHNCFTCPMDAYRCRMSDTCIASDKKCDGVGDCPHNEDEWDCFALTDGNGVLLDADLRPHLNTKGVVSVYYNDSWTPWCADWTHIGPHVASDICVYLGLSDYESFGVMKIDARSLDFSLFRGRIKRDVKEGNCTALYVKCSNATLIGSEANRNEANGLNATPWNVVILANGVFKCTGTLVNLNWVLTNDKCFSGIKNLVDNYVTVLAGKNLGYLVTPGPHEEIRRVVQSISLPLSEIVLLKLESNLPFTRYIRHSPVGTTIDSFRAKEDCIATGNTRKYRMHTVHLQTITNCTSSFRCFQRRDHLPAHKECHTYTPWAGTIVCDSNNGIHPVAVFHEPLGHCGFDQPKPLISLSKFRYQIINIMKNDNSTTIAPPPCEGLRCITGKCLSPSRVCDGILDCRDGADEEEMFCARRRAACDISNNCTCSKFEMKCANGKCVHRTAFCNKVDDCGDETDEPEVCSCFTYINLSQPHKICDGIMNCEDGSDEDPRLCKCKNNNLKCGNEDMCVPTDLICNRRNDCPNGEDEENCYAIKTINNNTNEGELLTLRSGLWHSGCFYIDVITEKQFNKFCEGAGFRNTTGTFMPDPPYDDGTDDVANFRSFDSVWMDKNGTFILGIRNGIRPIYRWKARSKHCRKLYIRCT